MSDIAEKSGSTCLLRPDLRRSRLDICFELMEATFVRKEIKPTQLMYKANLSWKMMTEMLDYLTERGLVRSSQNGARRTISLTELGASCLGKLHEARKMLDPERDEPTSSGFEELRVIPSQQANLRSGESDGRRAW